MSSLEGDIVSHCMAASSRKDAAKGSVEAMQEKMENYELDRFKVKASMGALFHTSPCVQFQDIGKPIVSGHR